MSDNITEGKSLLRSFPYSLSRDQEKYGIAEIVSDKLAAAAAETDMAKIYPVIDDLPEEVLDILAYDFKVEWYEYNAPLENKRQTVKECILIHKYKGTRYATETALRSIYPASQVKEWFEYGGKPYHFKVMIWDNANDKEKCKSVIQKINYYKNVRSILEEAAYIVTVQSKARVYCGAVTTGKKKSIYCTAKKFEVWQREGTSVKVRCGAKMTGRKTERHMITAREV